MNWHIKAVKLLTELVERLNLQVRLYGDSPMSQETMHLRRDLVNLHDYYLYAVLDATKDTAQNLINLLSQLEQQAVEQGDKFHASFFFTLAELLAVKYDMQFGEKKTDRRDFDRNLNDTRNKYGLGEVGGSVENQEQVRKAKLTGYVV